MVCMHRVYKGHVKGQHAWNLQGTCQGLTWIKFARDMSGVHILQLWQQSQPGSAWIKAQIIIVVLMISSGIVWDPHFWISFITSLSFQINPVMYHSSNMYIIWQIPTLDNHLVANTLQYHNLLIPSDLFSCSIFSTILKYNSDTSFLNIILSGNI